MELLRVRFDEQVRGEKRKSASTPIESQVTGSLKPWREVVNPHKDVASGRYQQAEFAADLWQVHLGEGTDEYRKPVEFFRRTYLTESLKKLLTGAVRRLAGDGGDPVVQLQTNFGGGKTHSLIALYHLAGAGAQASALAGVDELLGEAGVEAVPVQDFNDVYADPQLAHRAHFVRMTHPFLGEGAYERNGFRLSQDDGGYQRPSPTLGQHNGSNLGDVLGLSASEQAQLAEEGVLE